MVTITNRPEEQQIEIDFETPDRGDNDAEYTTVAVYRDEDGSVHIRVVDHQEGTEERLVLGSKDWTTKL